VRAVGPIYVQRRCSTAYETLAKVRSAGSAPAALEETLGSLARKVYALMVSEMRSSHDPMAQVTLVWVSGHMPALADRIPATARLRDEQAA
jgi:hypothetical protein